LAHWFYRRWTRVNWWNEKFIVLISWFGHTHVIAWTILKWIITRIEWINVAVVIVIDWCRCKWIIEKIRLTWTSLTIVLWIIVRIILIWIIAWSVVYRIYRRLIDKNWIVRELMNLIDLLQSYFVTSTHFQKVCIEFVGRLFHSESLLNLRIDHINAHRYSICTKEIHH